MLIPNSFPLGVMGDEVSIDRTKRETSRRARNFIADTIHYPLKNQVQEMSRHPLFAHLRHEGYRRVEDLSPSRRRLPPSGRASAGALKTSTDLIRPTKPIPSRS